jgi:transglutaminase-like putative cysteine protease
MFKRLILSFSFLLIFAPYMINASQPDCELIRYDLKCTIVKGVLFRDYLFVIQINNRAGEVNARISIPFSKSNKIIHLNGNIEDLDGRIIRELSRKDITDISAVSDQIMYTDEFLRTFELIHNQYPYRIRYSYRVEFKDYFYIASWIPVLGENIPTRNATLTVELPLGFRYRAKVKDVPSPQTDTIGAMLRLCYEVAGIPSYNSEKYAPSPMNSLQHVLIIPENFNWLISGSHESWQTYGLWESKLIEDAGVLPVTEKDKITKLIKGITDNTKKVRKIYAYLQDNTRYINVKIDVGGLKPYPAEYVANHKYGDCKALTNYMKSLLDAAGITSYYTNVIADDNPAGTDLNFPSQQFNHVFLYVPLEKDTFFLECTSNTFPFGYVGIMTQDRPAFVIDGMNSHFVRTPALKLDDVQNKRIIQYAIRPEGSAETKIDFCFKGDKYELFNAVLSQLSSFEQEEFVRDYIPAANFELKEWHLNRKHRDTAEIELTAELHVPNAIKRYGNDISLQLFPVFTTVFEIPAKRTLPVVVNYPEYVRDSLVYSFPDFMHKNGKSNEVSIKSVYGEYYRKIEHANNKMLIIRYFRLNKGEYTCREYPEFYKFITEMQQADRKNIFLLEN